MEYDNTHIRQQLRQEEALPEGFAWDDMRTGILAEIDALEQDDEPTIIPAWLYWKETAGLLATTLLLLTYYCYQYASNSEIQLEEYAIVPSDDQSKREHTIKTLELEVPNTHLSEVVTKTTTTGEADVGKQLMLVTHKEHLGTQTITRDASTDKHIHPSAHSQEVDIVFEKLESSASTSAIKTNAPQAQLDANRLLPIVPMLSPKVLSLSTQQQVLLLSSTPSQPSKKAGEFALALSGGSNIWTANYKNTVREDLEAVILGAQVGIAATYRLPKQFFASAGVQWQQLQSQFKYESSQLASVEERSALVRLDINLISNDTTFVYMDTTINVIETRMVRHANQHQVWNIPVVLGYEWQTERFRFGLGAGGVLAIQSKANGRTWNGTDIIAYDENTPIYSTNYGAGIIAQASLDYKLNKDFYIGASLSNTSWLKNWSIEEGVQAKPNVTALSLAVGKTF